MNIIKKFEHYSEYDNTEPSRWEKEKRDIDDILNIAKDVCKVEIHTIVQNNRTNDKLSVNICRLDNLDQSTNWYNEPVCTEEEIRNAAVSVIERLKALDLHVVENFYVLTRGSIGNVGLHHAYIKISEYDQENIERIKRSFHAVDSIEISNIRLLVD